MLMSPPGTILTRRYGQGSVRDAVSAVVHGALDANRQLKDQQLQDQVRVEEIEIIELYQDMAAEAAHELLTLAERLNGDATSGAVISVAPRRLSPTSSRGLAVPLVIRLSNCPTRPSASTWSSCLPAGKFSSSLRKSGNQGALAGTYRPSSAMRPRIDCARTALSPRVGNDSRKT